MSDDALAVGSDTGPWAMVPAWVLDSGVSPRAVFLYAVLSLYADGGSNGAGGTTRTRRKLAGRLDCSVNTLDRAVAELEGIRAVHRSPTVDASGDQGPNRWTVFRARPGGPTSGEGGGPMPEAPRRTRPPTDPDPQIPLVSEDALGPQVPLVAWQEFEDFWKVYPRRTAKAEARKAWPKAVKKVDPTLIVSAARRYAIDPNLPEPQFIPHAATWLNGERWNDGPLPQRSRGKSPTSNLPPSDRVMAEDPNYWEEP